MASRDTSPTTTLKWLCHCHTENNKRQEGISRMERMKRVRTEDYQPSIIKIYLFFIVIKRLTSQDRDIIFCITELFE